MAQHLKTFHCAAKQRMSFGQAKSKRIMSTCALRCSGLACHPDDAQMRTCCALKTAQDQAKTAQRLYLDCREESIAEDQHSLLHISSQLKKNCKQT